MGDETARDASAWVVVAQGAREEIDTALWRRDLAPRVRERLEMVKGIALGQSLADVARWSGRSERTVMRWLGALAAGGRVALAAAARGGRPPKADPGDLAALEQAVTTPPRDLGLLFDAWTSARLSA